MPVTIYHNPKCATSRAALRLLRAHGIEPTVIDYLRDPPDRARLETLLALLGFEPRQLLRTREAEFRQAGLDDPGASRTAILRAMVRHPRLIQRPIVVIDERRAVLARPAERLLAVLGRR